MHELNVIDSPAIFLGRNDTAIVLREESKSLDLYVPGLNDPDDKEPVSLIIASWLVYAYASEKPEVRNAFKIIQKNYEEDTRNALIKFMSKKDDKNVDNSNTNN